MVQDYFSLCSKDKRYFLLRIHHKVDFSDEIAWAHCWDVKKEKNALESIRKHILDYLAGGFDVIENWQNKDQPGWHESILHLGFEEVLVEMKLVSESIDGKSDIAKNIFEEINKRQNKFESVSVPTYVGDLYVALHKKGIECLEPRVKDAIYYVPLKDIFIRNWDKIVSGLSNYSIC